MRRAASLYRLSTRRAIAEERRSLANNSTHALPLPPDVGQGCWEVSEFLQAKAREFEGVRLKYEQFHGEGESLGFFEGAHEAFFVAAMQYLHLIQLDSLAYTVAQELTHIVDLEQTNAHVHSEIENSFYLLDHGLQDVRVSIADVLLQSDDR